jgi:hypothetical protein
MNRVVNGDMGGHKRRNKMGVPYSYLINGSSPSTVGGTGTGVLYFQPPPSQNLWNVGAPGVNASATSNQIGGTVSGTNATGQLSVPGRAVLNGQRFDLQASGNILFGAGEASTTGAIKIYLNSAQGYAGFATPTYHDLLGTNVEFSNVALDNVYYPWTVSLTVEGDSLSGIVQGTYSALLNGSLVASAAFTSVTGINFNAEPAFGFVIGVQFGASNAGNTANLYEFQIANF